MPCDKLDENGLKLVSKGEIAKEIHLESLLKTDQIAEIIKDRLKKVKGSFCLCMMNIFGY
jgi:ribosome maturation protein Sdo1